MIEGKAVLIIDDDSTFLNMYGDQLKFEGMLVEYARDGVEALNMATQNRPNLIILDIMMPKMNGFEVLKTLKADETTKDIPVIVLSALNDPDKKTMATELGANDYLVKSEIFPIDLSNKIETILQQ